MSNEARGLRVAYVTPYGRDYTSITKHTTRRREEWRALGVDTEQFLIGDDARSGKPAWRNLVDDWRMRGSLVRSVAQFNPDVIYVRWLAPIPGLLKLLGRLAPVVLDVHADDLIEVARGSTLRTLFLKAFRAKEIAAAEGATFVVTELSEMPSFAGVRGPRSVFPNASWLTRREGSPAGRPRVGISVGSPHPWAGLDRFSQLAASAGADIDWVVVCPSASADAVRAAVGPEISVVATQGEGEYVAELETWSVAFGTLALERAGLRTASPLKARDYLGMGIPTVLPYWDEGVAEISDELLLKLAGPTDAPVERIDPSLIRSFIAKAHGRNLPADVSARAAGAEIERRRVEFLASFSGRR